MREIDEGGVFRSTDGDACIWRSSAESHSHQSHSARPPAWLTDLPHDTDAITAAEQLHEFELT